MQPVRFGTDGWRGVMAEDFTVANLTRVAQATADCWAGLPPTGRPLRAVIGYDRRFLSPHFAARVAEVFAANQIEVLLTAEPTPTPAVALAVQERQALGGVVITASHNPPHYNGYKLKAADGGAVDAAFCRAVEARLDQTPTRRLPLEEALHLGRVRRVDLRPAHARAVRRLVDFVAVAAARLRVAHDAMHGAGAGCFQTLLAGSSCRVTTLRGEPDAWFGGARPEPVPELLKATSAWLRAHPHDVCLVSDGDADRLAALDERGRPLSSHQLMALVLWHLLTHRRQRGTVVKSLNTTSLIERITAAHGLPVHVTGVGFTAISAALRQPGVLIGLEESGSLGFPAHLPDRDGLAAGLILLELLAWEGRSLSVLLRRLEREFGPSRYGRLDLPLPPREAAAVVTRLRRALPTRLLGRPVTEVLDFDGVKCLTRDGAWLMWRASGTEPLLRIYAEAASTAEVRRLMETGRRLAGRT